MASFRQSFILLPATSWNLQQSTCSSASNYSARTSYLPCYGLYYEHFGMATAEAKLEANRKAKLRFMYTTVIDEPEIEDAIVDQLAFTTIR